MYPTEAGRRRLNVLATWTPLPRSRTDSRTRLRATSRESGSPRSRTSSPTGHRKVLPDGTSISIEEWRRWEDRDKEMKLMDEIKTMRQEKDDMIGKVLQQIFGAMNDDCCD